MNYREQAGLDRGNGIIFTERQLILGSFPIHLILLLLDLTNHISVWGHAILCIFSLHNWINKKDDIIHDKCEINSQQDNRHATDKKTAPFIHE